MGRSRATQSRAAKNDGAVLAGCFNLNVQTGAVRRSLRLFLPSFRPTQIAAAACLWIKHTRGVVIFSSTALKHHKRDGMGAIDEQGHRNPLNSSDRLAVAVLASQKKRPG